MKPTRTRLIGVATALSTIAIAIPASPAGAATAAPVPARPAAAVVGTTFISTAASTFTNMNNQVSPGGNSSGSQSAR
ncbi:MAG: hypothetical protein JWN32_913 [Solirubrobacterales bacterium]|nr:hypothetical protein [Solirubrobacterales bacterium]